MKNGFTISEIISAKASEIYKAWLSSEGHTAMTGSPAQVDGKVGGKFSAWDGYIFGTILGLTPDQHIVQIWRTSEFPTSAPDSQLIVLLEEVTGGTKVTLNHSDMPEGQADSYRHGWEEFYFKPMKEYFKK
jgi:activator of HSP90 ATPase